MNTEHTAPDPSEATEPADWRTVPQVQEMLSALARIMLDPEIGERASQLARNADVHRPEEEPPPAQHGRHFAPYGSVTTLCGLEIPKPTGIDPSTGEYSDDRYTIARARTTCAHCRSRITTTDAEPDL